MKEARAGDVVKWRGRTWTIAKIYGQDYWEGYGWRIEFEDTNGGYHHWKQELDGGELIREGERKKTMKLNDLTFEKITNYDPYNERAKADGSVTEWVARNRWGNAVAFGYTKADCLQDARRYIWAYERGVES